MKGIQEPVTSPVCERDAACSSVWVSVVVLDVSGAYPAQACRGNSTNTGRPGVAPGRNAEKGNMPAAKSCTYTMTNAETICNTNGTYSMHNNCALSANQMQQYCKCAHAHAVGHISPSKPSCMISKQPKPEMCKQVMSTMCKQKTYTLPNKHQQSLEGCNSCSLLYVIHKQADMPTHA